MPIQSEKTYLKVFNLTHANNSIYCINIYMHSTTFIRFTKKRNKNVLLTLCHKTYPCLH